MQPVFVAPEKGDPCMVTLGGRQLELRYNLRAIKALEKFLGVNLLKGEDLAASAFQSADAIAEVIYLGLHHSDQKDITKEWVEDEVEFGMVPQLAPAIAYAIHGRFRDELPNVQTPQVSTSDGSTSGRSDGTTSDVVN